MKTFQDRAAADKYFTDLGQIPKICLSGETGDVLMAEGELNMIN